MKAGLKQKLKARFPKLFKSDPHTYYDIPGYEGLYEINARGTIRLKSFGQVIMPATDEQGAFVWLRDTDLRGKKHYTDQLYAEVFQIVRLPWR